MQLVIKSNKISNPSSISKRKNNGDICLTDLSRVGLAPAPRGRSGASCKLSSLHDSCLHRLTHSRPPGGTPSTGKLPKTSARFVRLRGTSQHFTRTRERGWRKKMKSRWAAAETAALRLLSSRHPPPGWTSMGCPVNTCTYRLPLMIWSQ